MKKSPEEYLADLAEILEALNWEMVFLSHKDIDDTMLEIEGKPVGGIVMGSESFIKEVVPRVSDLSADDIEEAFKYAEDSEDGMVDLDRLKEEKAKTSVKPAKKPKNNTFH
jgi:hypothetical protein